MDDQVRGRPRSQLAEYEARFGVPSDRLADAFRRIVHLVETQEFLDWSALYSAYVAASTSAQRKPASRAPEVVRSLDDYWSWFAEQLDYSGGRPEPESVQVQRGTGSCRTFPAPLRYHQFDHPEDPT